MGLLGHALALRAGMSYEELLKRRICNPLGLKETTVTLTAEQEQRFARGHNPRRIPMPHWDSPTLAGAGALRSSVNDLLRFLRANIDPSRTPLETALRATHILRFEPSDAWRVAMAWHFLDLYSNDDLWHTGSFGGFKSFAVFNSKLKIAVVVLGNTSGDETEELGLRIRELL